MPIIGHYSPQRADFGGYKGIVYIFSTAKGNRTPVTRMRTWRPNH